MKSKFRSNNGFTIMELMIVVVIVGIISAMAVPRFLNAYQRMQFKSYNRDIESNIRMARSLAITEKETYAIALDPVAYTTTLFKKNSASTNPTLLEFGDQVISIDTLNMGLNFIGTSMPNHTMAFNPNGTVEFDGGGNGLVWTVVQNSDMTGWYVINVLASTGRLESNGGYY